MTSDKVKKARTGVFIDGSNLFWAMNAKNKEGKLINYRVNFAKLKAHLEKCYSPVFFNYYVCENNNAHKEPYITQAMKQKAFIKALEGIGYSAVRKDLKHLRDQTKCDTDVEIVMDMHKFLDDVDNFVLFTGDSDFLSAVESFNLKGKFIRIYSFRSNLSWELKKFAITHPRCNYKLLDELKGELE